MLLASSTRGAWSGPIWLLVRLSLRRYTLFRTNAERGARPREVMSLLERIKFRIEPNLFSGEGPRVIVCKQCDQA